MVDSRTFISPKPIKGATPLYLPVGSGERLMYVGRYNAGRLDRRQTQGWIPTSTSADAAAYDLKTIRARSRDAIRNIPIARGIRDTKVVSVVGTGFQWRFKVDRDVLSLTEEQADAWERLANREWQLFWSSQEIDLERQSTGDELLEQVYSSRLESGDVLINMPRIERGPHPYSLKLQIIEADRLSNAYDQADSDTLINGVERSPVTGEVINYHVSRFHPGDYTYTGTSRKWDILSAFNQDIGLRNVIHYFRRERPGQSRGIPDLAPVLELIAMVGNYADSEALAALISSYFTVFITTPHGENGLDLVTDLEDETGAASSDTDMKLGAGLIVDLAEGEIPEFANPGRPNTAFQAFVEAIMQQVGMGANLPYSVLIKHFPDSYTAAKAAFNEAWRYYHTERARLASSVLDIIKENWAWEAVALGRIPAPGFFRDPIIRRAYLRGMWVAPPRGTINEGAEITAAVKRIDAGISTIEQETIQATGGDWEMNHPQTKKEYEARKSMMPAATAVPAKGASNATN